MKNIQFLFSFLLSVLFLSCNNDGGDCGKPQYAIEVVQPTGNPAGYEVAVGGVGLTPESEIFFGTVPAAAQRWDDNLDVFITKVPTGITGVVDITAREGDCSARQEFEVFSAYPGNVPQSPVNFIIPTVISGAVPGGISNLWRNLYDEGHSIGLFDFDDDKVLDTNCNETCSGEVHNTNPELGSFQTPNPITGTYDLNQKRLEITIDRRPNGGQQETYDGIFIDPEIAPIQQQEQKVILLTSRKDGRQLVIVFIY